MENQAGVDVDIRRDVDGGDSGSGSSDDERVEEVVNVKPPYLVDLEIESMKKFILEYKRYAQKCPRQLLRSMQQFVWEEHLEIICSESGEEIEQFMELARDDFISAMLRMHAANSSRKWRLLIKNAKWKNRTGLYLHMSNMSKISAFGSMWQGVSSSTGQRNCKMFRKWIKA